MCVILSLINLGLLVISQCAHSKCIKTMAPNGTDLLLKIIKQKHCTEPWIWLKAKSLCWNIIVVSRDMKCACLCLSVQCTVHFRYSYLLQTRLVNIVRERVYKLKWNLRTFCSVFVEAKKEKLKKSTNGDQWIWW